MLGTIGDAIAAAVFGTRAVAKEAGEGEEAPASVDPEAGTVEMGQMGERQVGVEVVAGGAGAGICWRDDSKLYEWLGADIVNVVATQNDDIIRAAEA